MDARDKSTSILVQGFSHGQANCRLGCAQLDIITKGLSTVGYNIGRDGALPYPIFGLGGLGGLGGIMLLLHLV